MRRGDYLACYDEGRRLASRHFVVFIRIRQDKPLCLSEHAPTPRVGMAVTKKIGCAVIRNRVKRVLREFFRLHQQAVPPGVDLVVIPKKHLSVAAMTLDMTSRELMPVLAEVCRMPGLFARAAADRHVRGADAPHGSGS